MYVMFSSLPFYFGDEMYNLMQEKPNESDTDTN